MYAVGPEGTGGCDTNGEQATSSRVSNRMLRFIKSYQSQTHAFMQEARLNLLSFLGLIKRSNYSTHVLNCMSR